MPIQYRLHPDSIPAPDRVAGADPPMLRFSRQADYGLVLMSHFARRSGSDVLSARDLSVETGLPLPTVGKVLKLLARRGLLQSQRGVHGGYVLARAAGEISVAAVVQALDGPVEMADCVPGAPRTCDHEPRCPMRSPMHRLNAVVLEALSRVSLDDLNASVTR